MKEFQFWLAWCDGADSRGYVHNSYSDAVNDCEFLARIYTGQRWYVLEAKEYMKVDDVSRYILFKRDESDDLVKEMPF